MRQLRVQERETLEGDGKVTAICADPDAAFPDRAVRADRHTVAVIGRPEQEALLAPSHPEEIEGEPRLADRRSACRDTVDATGQVLADRLAAPAVGLHPEVDPEALLDLPADLLVVEGAVVQDDLNVLQQPGQQPLDPLQVSDQAPGVVGRTIGHRHYVERDLESSDESEDRGLVGPVHLVARLDHRPGPLIGRDPRVRATVPILAPTGLRGLRVGLLEGLAFLRLPLHHGDLHGGECLVVRGVVHCHLRELELRALDVPSDLLDREVAPEAVRRHDLVELLELPKARDVGSAVDKTCLRQGEAAGAGKGGVVPQLLVDGLRLCCAAHEHEAQEGLEQGEEVLGGPAAQTVRYAPGADLRWGHVNNLAPLDLGLRDDGARGIQGGTFQEKALPCLLLRLGVGSRLAAVPLDTLLSLVPVELPESLVVLDRGREEGAPVQVAKQTKPGEVGLVEETIIGLDDVDQRDLNRRELGDYSHDLGSFRFIDTPHCMAPRTEVPAGETRTPHLLYLVARMASWWTVLHLRRWAENCGIEPQIHSWKEEKDRIRAPDAKIELPGTKQRDCQRPGITASLAEKCDSCAGSIHNVRSISRIQLHVHWQWQLSRRLRTIVVHDLCLPPPAPPVRVNQLPLTIIVHDAWKPFRVSIDSNIT